jgi:organic radical activating enzyme
MIDPHGSLSSIKEKSKLINAVSPTYCLAKWLQSTILLYNGETHSCHHPSRHKITMDDIKDNPKGIHNTVIKIHARQDLINGVQTKECDYCWNIENLDNDWVSDRIYKSTYSWALPYLEEVKASGLGENIDPTYMEVAFENTCNFKCLYCSPESSSRWQEEVTHNGPIQFDTWGLHDIKWLKNQGRLPIHRDDPNPYIDAFWKWWPDLYPKLHTFRITGGEPLLSKHTWAVLEYIKENPNPNLTLAINTNMNVPFRLIEKLVQYVNEIAPHIKGFDIYTSLESTGEQAEYARSGLVYDEFVQNCYYFLDNTPPQSRLHFMTTINLMSVPTFMNFLELIQAFREKYTVEKHDFRVRTMISYLRWPKFLSINLVAPETKQIYAKEWLDFINDFVITDEVENHAYQVFYNEEADQIKRLVDYMLTSVPEQKQIYDEFRTYIQTCDERRSTSFAKTFPELEYMLNKNYYGKI